MNTTLEAPEATATQATPQTRDDLARAFVASCVSEGMPDDDLLDKTLRKLEMTREQFRSSIWGAERHYKIHQSEQRIAADSAALRDLIPQRRAAFEEFKEQEAILRAELEAKLAVLARPWRDLCDREKDLQQAISYAKDSGPKLVSADFREIESLRPSVEHEVAQLDNEIASIRNRMVREQRDLDHQRALADAERNPAYQAQARLMADQLPKILASCQEKIDAIASQRSAVANRISDLERELRTNWRRRITIPR